MSEIGNHNRIVVCGCRNDETTNQYTIQNIMETKTKRRDNIKGEFRLGTNKGEVLEFE